MILYQLTECDVPQEKANIKSYVNLVCLTEVDDMPTIGVGINFYVNKIAALCRLVPQFASLAKMKWFTAKRITTTW